MVERPLITIGIPSYNSARFLPDAIASIMYQDLHNFEIVIVDNASEDNTEEIVRSMRSDQLRYFRNQSNLGSRENCNRCLSEARGVYFKFLCADDVLLKGILLKQLTILENQPNVSLVTCDFKVTDSELQAESTCRMFGGSHAGSRVINACLSGLSNHVGGPSNIMFRRADATGLALDPSYRFVSDLKFALQLLERGAYVNVDEVGYLYRRHALSDTETNCPVDIRMSEYLRLVDEFSWWNPLNCVQAVRRGGVEGKSMAIRNWQTASRAANVAKAITAFADILHTRYVNSHA